MSSGALSVDMDDNSYPEAMLTHLNGDQYKVMWRTSGDEKMVTSSHLVQDSASPSGTGDSRYLNITLPLAADHITTVAYVFTGPGTSVESPQFTSNSSSGCTVQVKVDGIAYNLAISTQYDNFTSRMTYLGHTDNRRILRSYLFWL